jgi:enoyl-CoA hydratase/carnithine racemase
MTLLSDADRACLEDITYEKASGVARITLARPEAGNAITAAMHRSLRLAWSDVRDDPGIRVVIVTGAGSKHFCTGADLRQIASEGYSDSDGPLQDAVHLSPRQNRVWKPVVCAVNGLVVGGGLHFVVDADIVVAAEHAQFMDTHVEVGQVGAIEMIGLVNRMPLGSALRMLLMGSAERLGAHRARDLGLVDEVVPQERLHEECDRMAEVICSRSPDAVSLSLQAMWGAVEHGYTHAMEYGWSLLRLHRHHPDAKEGPRAFAEHRSPVWTT